MKQEAITSISGGSPLVDPAAFGQIEKSATDMFLKVIIPIWIILSVSVTVWSYKSTRVKVFWKNLYKSVFPPKSRSSKEEKRWFRK